MDPSQLEKILDHDFLFYLMLTRNYEQNFKDRNEIRLCQAWLNKLCREKTRGLGQKSNRNRYLTQLLTCLLTGDLQGVFAASPLPGPLAFCPESTPAAESPRTDWLDELASGGVAHTSRDGRTYLATKTLEDGRGAFAYLAVTLNDGEPEWAGQAGSKGLDAALHSKYEYAMGDTAQPELATVLASRKNKELRARAMNFYQDILISIQKQISGEIKEGSSPVVNELLTRLVQGLHNTGGYQKYRRFGVRERFYRLLEKLHAKLLMRIRRMEKREILLDAAEDQVLADSLLSETFRDEDKYGSLVAVEDLTYGRCLPTDAGFEGTDWSRGISAEMDQNRLYRLQYNYPPELIAHFEQLMEREKWSLGERSKRRHELTVLQLHQDMRRERESGQAQCDEILLEISLLQSNPFQQSTAGAPFEPDVEEQLRYELEHLADEEHILLATMDKLAARAGIQ